MKAIDKFLFVNLCIEKLFIYSNRLCYILKFGIPIDSLYNLKSIIFIVKDRWRISSTLEFWMRMNTDYDVALWLFHEQRERVEFHRTCEHISLFFSFFFIHRKRKRMAHKASGTIMIILSHGQNHVCFLEVMVASRYNMQKRIEYREHCMLCKYIQHTTESTATSNRKHQEAFARASIMSISNMSRLTQGVRVGEWEKERERECKHNKRLNI